jgi:NAD(P)H-hydrate epimerase
MRRAATAALNTLQRQWPEARRLAIFCGSGNNGGDGYLLGALAAQRNLSVTIYELGQTASMSDETRLAKEAALQAGVPVSPFDSSDITADLIVDALFGTGLCREVSGHYRDCIEFINQSLQPVLALDIPSGLHANTGQVMGVAVQAMHTTSFIGLNMGLFTGEGPAYTGTISYHSLDVPDMIFDEVVPTAERLNFDRFRSILAPRQRTGHKGHYGHTVIIGGDTGMAGAVCMAAKAAARSGSGLTSVGTHPSHSAQLISAQPEIMFHGLNNHDDLDALVNKASVIVLGPGLGLGEWGQTCYSQCVQSDQPMVIDADALNLLSTLNTSRGHWVLTPHPGEAARLLACSTSVIQSDRVSAIQQLQQRYGGVIVLKGAGTLIYDGVHTIQLCSAGNPGMGSGGMGDVLAGLIGGLIAQGLSLFDAARLGVLVHATAADQAADIDGERGLLATDLLPHIRHYLNLIED